MTVSYENSKVVFQGIKIVNGSGSPLRVIAITPA